MSDEVEIIERTTAYRGYFRIDRYRLRHRLFAGGMSPPVMREVFERGHAVALLPYDPVRDEVVLIEQFRVGAYAAGRTPWLIEIVAGIMEPQEVPEEVARREATEETGLEIGRLAFITETMVSPGGTSETVTIYCGEADAGKADGIHGLADEGEDIRVMRQSAEAAIADVAAARIESAPAVIALQWLALNRDSLRRHWTDPGRGALAADNPRR